MKLSVTIPQIFYDLIARVLPGFLFLLMLNFELYGTRVEIIQLASSSSNSMAVFLNALVYAILSYFMGWILLAFTFRSFEKRVRKEHESKLNENSPSMLEMYYSIRIKDEAVGFRIVKLRAEARMLETSRTGMVYVFVISLGLLLLSRLGLVPLFSQPYLVWGIKLCIPIVLAVAFWKCERRAWNNYYGNIPKSYEILFETRVRNGDDELSKLRMSLKKGENASQEQLDDICRIWEKRIAPSDKEKELLVLVDSKGNFIQPKLTAPRWLCHLLALRHRCAHVLLQWQSPNLGKVFILQVRSWDKSDSPGHLDISVGGHVKGEATPERTAYEEMEEELGIARADLRGGELIPHDGYESYNERDEDNFYNAEWRDVYVGEILSLEKVRFNDEEVAGIYLCPESEARNLLEQRFIPIASALELSLPKCL